MRTNVSVRLSDADQRVRDGAFHAAVATALQDALGAELRAALSLPWALCAVTGRAWI